MKKKSGKAGSIFSRSLQLNEKKVRKLFSILLVFTLLVLYAAPFVQAAEEDTQAANLLPGDGGIETVNPDSTNGTDYGGGMEAQDETIVFTQPDSYEIDNIIMNWDFEDVDSEDDSDALYWEQEGANSSKTFKRGSTLRSMQLKATEIGVKVAFWQEVKVVEGESYKGFFTLYEHSDVSGDGRVTKVEAIYLASNGDELGRETLVSYDAVNRPAIWQKSEPTIIPPQGADKVRIYAYAENFTGSYFYDQFKLTGPVADPDSQGPEVPTEPPAAVANLTVDSFTHKEISISWTASEGADGYKVLRNGAEVGNVATTSFSDTELAPETTYIYKVAAYNFAGSTESEEILVTTSEAPDVEIEELLLNGGFDTKVPGDSNDFADWEQNGANSEGGWKHKGQFSLRFLQGTGLTEAWQDVPVASEASYTISGYGWIHEKSTYPEANPERVSEVIIRYLNSSGQQIGDDNVVNRFDSANTVDDTYKWINFVQNFETPEGTDKVRIYIYAADNSKYYLYDTFSLVGQKPAPKLPPPSAPTILSINAPTYDKVNLSWTASENADGYKIYRNGELVGDTALTLFTDTGLTGLSVYSYTVSAYNADRSTVSDVVTVTTPPQPETGEVLLNANFDEVETIGETVHILHWELDGATSTDEYKRHGTRSLMLQSNNLESTIAAWQDVKVFAGCTYNTIAYVYEDASVTDDPDRISEVVIRFLDSAGQEIGSKAIATYDANYNDPSQTGVYKKFENSFTVPEGTDKIRVYIYAKNFTGFYIHDWFSITGAKRDTEAPTAPTDVTAVPISSNEASLSWTESTDNMEIAGYKIFRNGEEVGDVTSTSFVDVGLTASTTYTYTVAAYDFEQNLSDESSQVSVLTAPNPPQNIIGYGATPTETDMYWPMVDGAVSYIIYRDGVEIATTDSNKYRDTGLIESTLYTYTIKAVNSEGTISALSAEVKITTSEVLDVTPPTRPVVKATADSSNQITLRWVGVKDDVSVTDHDVYRNGELIETEFNTIMGVFPDSGLQPGTTYRYEVYAKDAAGNRSEVSNTVYATTFGEGESNRNIDAVVELDYYIKDASSIAYRENVDLIYRMGYGFTNDNSYSAKAVVELPDGNIELTENVANIDKTVISVQVAELEPGEYPVTLSVLKGSEIIWQTEDDIVIRPAPPANTRITQTNHDSRSMIVDGEPYFPLGIFGVDADSLNQIADAGFNTTLRWKGSTTQPRYDHNIPPDHPYNQAVVTDYLDAVEAAGLYAFESPVKLAHNDLYQKYRDLAWFEKYPIHNNVITPGVLTHSKNHPAVVGYYSYDETDNFYEYLPQNPNHLVMQNGVEEWYDIVKGIDPYHSVMTLFAVGVSKNADWRAWDVVARDYYLNDTKHMSDIYKYMKQSQITAAEWNTPFIATPLFEEASAQRKPINGIQQRANSYATLISGANGIYWWDWAALYNDNWNALKQFVSEANELKPVLVERTPAQNIAYADGSSHHYKSESWIGMSKSAQALVKNHNGKTYIITVNTENAPIEVTFQLPEGYEGTGVVLFEGRDIEVVDGQFTESYEPYGRHVYEIPGTWAEGATLTMDATITGDYTVYVDPQYADDPTNGVKNSSFEESWGSTPGVPAYYENVDSVMSSGETGKDGAWHMDNTIAYDGNVSMRVTNTKPGLQSNDWIWWFGVPGFAQNGVELKGTANHTFSVYMKADRENVTVAYMDGFSIKHTTVSASEGWVRYSQPITSNNFRLYVMSEGTVWFDAIQVTPGNQPVDYVSPVLTNPGEYTGGLQKPDTDPDPGEDPKPAINLISDSSVEEGWQFSVKVALVNVPEGIHAEDITVNYDSGLFEFIQAQPMNIDTTITKVDDTTTGTVRVLTSNFGGISGNVDIFELVFAAKSIDNDISGSITVADAKLGTAPEGTVISVVTDSITIGIINVDKSALSQAIANAQSIYNAAVEGTEPGQYPEGSKAELMMAITQAQSVLDDDAAAQAEVNAAVSALQEAVEAFEEKEIQATVEDVNGDGEINVGDLAIVVYYYDTSSSSPNWDAAQAADVDNDGDVDIVDLAQIATRILEN